MSDRMDSRLREMTIRLIEMAPEAPPFPEEPMVQLRPSPTSHPTPPRRRSPLVLVGAAALAVMLAVGGPLLFDRLTSDDVAGPTTPPTASTVPPATEAPPSTAVPQPALPTTILEAGGLAGLPFGTDGDSVLSTLTNTLGDPTDQQSQQLVELDFPVGAFRWGDAEDGLGLIATHPHVRTTCWVNFCTRDVSDDGSVWSFSAWDHFPEPGTSQVALATPDGLTLGSTYRQLVDLYPGATVDAFTGGAIGFSLPGWLDGVTGGNGRLATSYQEVGTGPVPDEVEVTSLSASDGSMGLGCC